MNLDKEILEELKKLNTNINSIINILNSTNIAKSNSNNQLGRDGGSDLATEISARIAQARQKAQEQFSVRGATTPIKATEVSSELSWERLKSIGPAE